MRSCLRNLDDRPRSKLIDQPFKWRTLKVGGGFWFSDGGSDSLVVDLCLCWWVLI
jgi:hypothetical protein